MCTIGVLIVSNRTVPGPPEQRPIGRAAIALAEEGIDVVFGDRVKNGCLTGMRAEPGRWVPVESAPLDAVYDRFRSQTSPEKWTQLHQALAHVPISNPASMVLLCRDKILAQGVLVAAGIPMPRIEANPERFTEALESWGVAFLKPRFGAFGRGVQYVHPGDDLPLSAVGGVKSRLEPTFLQQAVPPPKGWAGVCLRINAQRLPDRTWHINAPVVRRSRHDRVVNASRGAEVAAGDDVLPELSEALRDLTRRTADALAAEPGGALLVEVGVDTVIARDGVPWVIEVNSRPQGRLEALCAIEPTRWSKAHLEATSRPIRTVALWTRGG